jgi:hypothetical protein
MTILADTSATVIKKLAPSAENFDKRKFYMCSWFEIILLLFYNLIPQYRQLRFLNF